MSKRKGKFVKVKASSAQEAKSIAGARNPNYVSVSAIHRRVVYKEYMVRMRPRKRK